MASMSHIPSSITDTTTSTRNLTTRANVPSILPVADGQRTKPQAAGRGRPRRTAAIQANEATARLMRLTHEFEPRVPDSLRRNTALSPWKPTSACVLTPDKNQFSQSQLAASATFQAGKFTQPIVQNALHRFENQSSDSQLVVPCAGGDHAFARPLSDSPSQSGENATRQASSLRHANPIPAPSRYHLVRDQPQSRRRPTLRDVVWFVMMTARLDAYHQKLVWLYAGNSLAARLKVLLWVRDFIRKQQHLPMLVNIREGIGAKGGVDSVFCRVTGCVTQKSFKEVQSAAEHVVSKHVGGMTWKCKWPGCEKAYNHSFDLKRHEKKHGMSTSVKQSGVKRIQRATSTRSRGGRNAQLATSSSFGPPLLAPVHQSNGHPPIFPHSSEYHDLSRWKDHGMPSPSSSTMGPPDSPFSTSFSHSTLSTPARTSHSLMTPSRSTGSHTELPAASHGSLLLPYSQTASRSMDSYIGGLPGTHAEDAYHPSSFHPSGMIYPGLGLSQGSTASDGGSNGELLFSDLHRTEIYTSSCTSSAFESTGMDIQHLVLPPAMPSIPLHATEANGSTHTLEDSWGAHLQLEAPIDLLDDGLNMYIDWSCIPLPSIEDYSTVEQPAPPQRAYQAQELHVYGSQLAHLSPGSRSYSASDFVAHGQLANQSTLRRAIASRSSRGQPSTSNAPPSDATYPQYAIELHQQMATLQEQGYGWRLAQAGNSEGWPPS